MAVPCTSFSPGSLAFTRRVMYRGWPGLAVNVPMNWLAPPAAKEDASTLTPLGTLMTMSDTRS